VVAAGRSAIGAAALATLAAPATACKPDLQQTVSIVSGPQILAVKSDPAEAAPRTTVRYGALVVDSHGAISTGVDWAFCNEREPLAELGPVSPKCYQPSGDWFAPFGSGVDATGVLPTIACRQFGPEVPEPQANQPPGRPVDPDATGGYYQPVRVVAAGNVVGVAQTRLSCGLAGTPDQVTQFAHHYISNVNPVIDSLSAGGTSLVTSAGGQSNPAQAGQRLALRVDWAPCPQATGVCGDGYCDLDETAASCPGDCMTLHGCGGAETYVNLDLAAHQLVTQREGMQVSWFATAGSFEDDRTGRDSNDPSSFATNAWQAPSSGRVHLWVVLRDDRGGVGWDEYLFDVR
jgi:hypothetical protein